MASDHQETANDSAPMLPKTDGETSVPPGAVSRYYTVPRTRYRNIAEIILIIDAVVSLALWILGTLINTMATY